MSYSIENVDWTKYLDRKQPLFLFAAFIRPYGTLLLGATGFRFEHQLHIFSGDSGTFLRSEKEMRNALVYFLRLAEEKDERLAVWRDKGVECNAKADEMIAAAKAGTLSVTPENFWDIYCVCDDIMLYDTVIPYRVLAAINSTIERGVESIGEKLQYALKLFESFRAGAKYPELVEHVFPLFWKLAADRAGISDYRVLSNTTPIELKTYFDGGKLPEEVVLRQRGAWCAFWENLATGEVVFDYNQEKFKKLNLLQDYSVTKEFKGNIAYKGIARGRVRIINSVTDIGDFEEGDIIVSFNTNPSLMPALIKCGGIVTDEGGIMCHAAIVSRELKKPCIIGTKIATRVLKDGDKVEVDAEKGIVRKL